MELQKLSPSLLKSLVAVVATLGKVAATVSGSKGDMKLTGSRESLWKRLETFTENLKGNLQHFADTASGKVLAKLKTTPEPTRASVTSAANAWQTSVTEAVGEWIQMTKEAIEVLNDCRVTAAAEGGTAADAAKRAGDLQEKVDNWLKSVDNLVAKTQKVPMVTDKEKAVTALEEYEGRVEEAKENTLAALRDMANAMVTISQGRAAELRAQRAENVLEPLAGLVVACGAATAIFQDLRRTVGAIKATLEGTKGESPDVLKDLVDQAEQLWRDSETLVNGQLDAITGEIQVLIPGGTSYEQVVNKCQKAIKYLLDKQ